jgi:hypothetical protein
MVSQRRRLTAPRVDGSHDFGRAASVRVETEPLVVVVPARYLLLPLASLLTGDSVKAMQRQIERGDRHKDKAWRLAPDGPIVIALIGYQKWAEDRWQP